MVDYREILRLRNLGYTQRQIASSVHSSRKTISDVFARADEKELFWPLTEATTNEDIRRMLYPERVQRLERKMPDCAYLHKEMAKSSVTLTLLWSEYAQKCRNEGQIPYQYTQFCDHYRDYVRKTKATMRIKRKPGELLEVDWAGSTLPVYDQHTGETTPAYIFVASLACSLYSYVEAFSHMKAPNWIQGHVNAFRFFSGSPRILVPDNLRTAVTKNTRDTLILNRSYNEMAQHYNCAVIPARPVSPKDKPNVEGVVGIISTWILAALRNEKFFTIEEMNNAIQEKLRVFNTKPFQKKRGSRWSAFEEEEKAYLQPLPASPYEMAVWSTAKVPFDYLITVDKNKYSVPFDLIGHTVEIRSTAQTVEVFFHNNRVASHIRQYGYGEPQIQPGHMPLKHRKYLTNNADTFLDWAKTVGKSTQALMQSFINAVKVEQMSYKNCRALMKLADTYPLSRIEQACSRALFYTPTPSIRTLKTILKTGQDQIQPESAADRPSSKNTHAFIRGIDYFKGDAND